MVMTNEPEGVKDLKKHRQAYLRLGSWFVLGLGEFLRAAKAPEQQALLRLIGTLVEVPPFA